MRWRAVAATLALALWACDATAATLEEVAARLSAVRTLRGEFSQTRTIRALSRPLASHGRFIISDLGLYWEQTAPFSSVLIADGERLVQTVADQPPLTLRSTDQPVALAISEVLLGILKGRRAELERIFRLDFGSEGELWTLHLRPIESTLAQAVESVVVTGAEYIEQVVVRGRAGDELTVTFSSLRTEPDELSEAERELYAP